MELLETIKDDEVDISLIREVPFTFSKNNLILPLKKENGYLIAAVADDKGIFAVSELARKYGLKQRIIKVGKGFLIEALTIIGNRQAQLIVFIG